MKSSKSVNKRSNRTCSGFTLMELLVVIAIIAVLAAITVMLTSRLRERAVTAADMGKLRQVATALASITQENRGIIPHESKSSDGSPRPGYVIPGTASPGEDRNRFNFHEAIDRFFDPPPNFSRGSIYNFQTRVDKESIYCSSAARPWAGYNPVASRKLPGPLWFSFNSYLNHGNWAGRMDVIPDQSKLVIVAETNHMGGEMRPKDKAVFDNDTETRYRVSRAGNTALYLFVDGHVEQLQGDRGDSYYTTRPGETNIWRWWK